MISNTLPCIESYNKEEPKLSHNSIIFASTSSKYFYPEHKTPNLFITNFLNKGSYVINKRRVDISDNYFYFLNTNDDIEIRFSNTLPLQTLIILFEENFLNDCLSYYKNTNEELLDSPNKCLSNDFKLPNIPFSFINSIKEKTLQLLKENHKEDIDALLFNIITEFLILNNDTSKQIKKIATAKKSTQEELYRRLFLAKELMNECVFTKLTLEQIAQEVCLNKFHFLSNFKNLYGITPHQYLMELKLQKALNLLQNKQHTVTETCFLIGFESLGSFSNSFKKRFHLSPSAVFNQNKIPNFR